MEIQYAIFLKTISTKGDILSNPINKIVVSDANHFNKMSLPLLVTFLGGESGKHLLNIHIRPRGYTLNEMTLDFRFDWPVGTALYTKVFGLEFKPKFHTIYDFLFEVDGKALAKIPLPIEKK